MSERRIRVGLDLSLGTEAWLGGLYYLRNLVRALAELPAAEAPELVGLAPVDDPGLELGAFAGLLPLARFRGGSRSGRLPAKVLNRVRLVADRRRAVPFGVTRAARQQGVDVVFPSLKGRRGRRPAHLAWVYDLQHLHLPQNFSAAELRYRDRAFAAIARRAPLVVVSSAAAAADFAGRFPEAAERLRVLRFTTVPEETWTAGDPAAVAARHGLPRPFLLFAGQLWLHKNHRLAFEAVRLLRDRGADACLACTGGTTDYRRPAYFAELQAFLAGHGLQDRVRVLGVVPRDDYVQLLRAAHALVQPSLFEGWSSVVEDARALGKPIVLSDLPVHREQAPPGAVYVDPRDARAWADALAGVLEAAPPVPDERTALARQSQRVREYARTFASIAAEVA